MLYTVVGSLIVSPQNSCSPVTCERDLIWKLDLCRCKEAGILDQDGALNPMTGVLIRQGRSEDKEKQRYRYTGKKVLEDWRQSLMYYSYKLAKK